MMHFKILWILGLFAMGMCPVANSAPDSNITIFLSFSMPNESLKVWMKDAEKIHAPVIVRGLEKGSSQSIINRMMLLAKEGFGGIQVDPNPFKKFHIEKVPAVVVAKSIPCMPNQTCMETYDVIYGDVHLDYALEKIANQNDEVSSIAQKALVTLRETQHV